MKISIPRIALALALTAGLTACEPAHEQIVHPTTASDAISSGAAPDPGPTASTTAPSDGTVAVRLTDYAIEMPTTLPPGPTTFQIANAGSEDHNFEIEGNGIEKELPAPLKPGESGTLDADLLPGNYEIYCPVGDHDEKGMRARLRVEDAPAGS
ncbi:MAG TPA: copper-binding protein [Thermoanaerobaculia bacterium]|nr:copper-binding protein [Thermoanaerobaculia bacterium]